MKRSTKIWLITAASLVLLGCFIFSGVMSVLKWNFRKLSTLKYETNSYGIEEEYADISVITDTADVVFVISEDGKCTVECYEQKNAKHKVEVKDGTLVIEINDTRRWYEYIGINFRSPKITVSLPQGEYDALSVKSDTGDVKIPKELKFDSIDVAVTTGDVTNYASVSGDVKIKTTTGDIRIEGVSVKALDLTVSTGDTTLTDVDCVSLNSKGSTGDISLNNVIAQEKLFIERDTGDVRFNGCDASELSVKTDTGDVRGTLLSDKVFITETDTGSINVPKTAAGGKCEICTETGDIRISISK